MYFRRFLCIYALLLIANLRKFPTIIIRNISNRRKGRGKKLGFPLKIEWEKKISNVGVFGYSGDRVVRLNDIRESSGGSAKVTEETLDEHSLPQNAHTHENCF